MILIDANLLIYAVHSSSPHHEAARHWLEETLSGTAHVGLPWIVALAFLRITTRGAIVERPLTPDRALAYVDSWLALPLVDLVAPGAHHWPILRNLLRTTGMAGNLTSDAHVAALALEHGATVYSADHDFRRFPGVDHIDPLRES